MKTGPHIHHCPIHDAKFTHEDSAGCKETYFIVCFGEHSREQIVAYLEKLRKERNDDLRDAAKDAQEAYSMGRFDGASESERSW